VDEQSEDPGQLFGRARAGLAAKQPLNRERNRDTTGSFLAAVAHGVRYPGTPGSFLAAVVRFAHYPGTPANWCFTLTFGKFHLPTTATPRLDLGVQFTCRLTEDEAMFSGASAILTAQMDCKIKSCNDSVPWLKFCKINCAAQRHAY
jgi:hypothetical protein